MYLKTKCSTIEASRVQALESFEEPVMNGVIALERRKQRSFVQRLNQQDYLKQED